MFLSLHKQGDQRCRIPPDPIRNEAELRQHISAYPSILDQRIQTRLDDLCLEFIDASQLIIGFYQAEEQGDFFILTAEQVMIQSPEQLQLSAISLPAASVSLIFLIAGIDHVLRINGQLTDNGQLLIQQSYFHCGRAAMRASLWQPATVSATTDPADPRIRLALMIPGGDQVLCVQGKARISAEAEKLQQAAVDNRPAKLVIEIADVRTHWLNNSALNTAFWQSSEQPVSGLTPFAKALATHMKGKGMMGKLTHLVVKKDASNLY